MVLIYLIIIIIYIINEYSKIKYNHITLHSTTLYTKFVEYILKLNNINYHKIFTPYINNLAYITVDNLVINLNPQLNDFTDEEVSLIPLSEEELNNLQVHTVLSNLSLCQSKILNNMSTINAY